MSALPLNSLEPRSETGGGIVRLDFVGDKVVIYLMFLAGILGVIENFISGTTTACFVPDNVTPRQGEYVNIFCSQLLPNIANLPYFVVLRGVIVLVPHYVWVLWHEGYFRYFLRAASQLDVCRDPETGRYYDTSVQRVKYLKEKYQSTRNSNSCCSCSCPPPLHVTYCLKLALQGTLLIVFAVLASIPYYNDFKFYCFSVSSPVDTRQCSNISLSPQYFPLQSSVRCATFSFLFTCIPSIVDLVIVIIAGLALALQLVYVLCLPKFKISLNGVEDAAQFSFQSSLPHDYWINNSYCQWYRYLLHPWKNFEFMLFILYRSSSGDSDLLRNMLIQEKIQKLRKERIDLLREKLRDIVVPHTDEELPTAIYEALPTTVCDEISTGRLNKRYQLLIITISFGPCAYYTIASDRNFKCYSQLKVVAIDFEEYICKISPTPNEGTSVVSIQVPADIYRRDENTVKEFHNLVQQLTQSNQYNRLICIIGPSKKGEGRHVPCLYTKIRNTPTPDIPRVFISVCPTELDEYEHQIFYGRIKRQSTKCGTVDVSWTFMSEEQPSQAQAVQQLLAGALKQLQAEVVRKLLAGAVQELLAQALNQLEAKTADQLLARALMQLDAVALQPLVAVEVPPPQAEAVKQQLAEALQHLPAGAVQQLLGGALKQLQAIAVQKLLAEEVQELLAGALQQLPPNRVQVLLEKALRQLPNAGAVWQVLAQDLRAIAEEPPIVLAEALLQAEAVPAGEEQSLAGALQQLPVGAVQQLLAGALRELPAEVHQLLAEAVPPPPAAAVPQLLAGVLRQQTPENVQPILVEAVKQLPATTVVTVQQLLANTGYQQLLLAEEGQD